MAESESLESLNKPQNHQNDTVKPIEEDVDNDYEQREEQQQVLINEPNEGDESLQSESRNLHVNDRTQGGFLIFCGKVMTFLLFLFEVL